MKLTVYRQAQKERADGVISYKGEDARPYVGDGLLFVADGLGGTSAIRHTKFHKEIFDPEKLPKILFGGIVDYEEDEELATYIRDSFFELYAIRDQYFDSVYNMKKSGYFASRIASVLLLAAMKKPPFAGGAIFDEITALPEEERADKLRAVGEEVAARLREEMVKVAEQGNLVYEGVVRGLALLGTTMTATLFREGEDYVDTLTFLAGDSRPYLLDKNGLVQTVADQEGKDGGMTNFIHVTEGSSFTLDCRYLRVAKPCILFNASDGCFDSVLFSQSPLAFEKLILETIAASSDMEAAAAALTAVFVENGGHDDSSTMALRAFGYPDYAALQEMAEERLSVIRDTYLTEIPYLLTRPAVMEAEEKKARGALVEALLNQSSVTQYCGQRVANRKSQKGGITPELAELDRRERELHRLADEAKGRAAEIVRREYIAFDSPDFKIENALAKRGRSGEEATLAGKHFRESLASLSDALALCLRDCMTAHAALSEALGAAATGISEGDAVWDCLAAPDCKTLLPTLAPLCEALEEKRAAVASARAALFAAIEEYYTKNREAASRVKDAALRPEAIVAALGDGQTDVAPTLLPHNAAALEGALTEVRDREAEANSCRHEWIVAYLKAKLDEVIEAITRRKGALPVSDEARAAIEEYRNTYGRWLADMANAETAAAITARRESLLASYLAEHERLIETETEEGEEEQ